MAAVVGECVCVCQEPSPRHHTQSIKGVSVAAGVGWTVATGGDGGAKVRPLSHPEEEEEEEEGDKDEVYEGDDWED